ncbi:hypothetical protein [Bacillus sp. BP-3]|nr:hypothetical protein [Bacillus sp. BP-3]
MDCGDVEKKEAAIVCALCFKTSHVAGKGPDRFYAQPDALVLP